MTRAQRLLSGLLCLSLVAPAASGCAPSGPEETVSVDESELTAAELKAAVKALDAAIAELHAHIATLETDVAALEAQNQAKANKIAQLVARIEARKQEVIEEAERNRRNALLFCAFGFCGAGLVSAIVAVENDGRVKELEAELAAAKAEQASVQSSLDAYAEKKARLSAHLETLRAKEDEIVALIAKSDAAPTKLERLALRTDRMTSLKGNLDAQAGTLGEIRDEAAELGAVLDEALVAVGKASAKADQLAEAARQATFKVLELLATGDPNAAAQKWLDRWVAKKTRELLKTIGWDPEGLIDRLVERAFPGQKNSPAAKELKKQLKKALKPASPTGSEAPGDDLEPDLEPVVEPSE